MKIAATFLLFTALLLVILNVYPVRVSRDMVISTKKSAMQSQNLVITSSLSALDTLSGEAVSQVMELLDVTPATRMLVTDDAGLILYDTSDEDDAAGRYAVLSEVAVALGGRSAFYCGYSGGAFVSRSAMPVLSGSGILGAVYLYEYDAEQGEIIRGLQRNLRNISAVIGAVGVIVVYLSAATLTGRIKRLAAAVGVVSSGDYAYRVDVRGSDEIARLSSEFNVLTGRLESTEEVRRRFVSDASHELRTPLTSIKGWGETLTYGNQDNVDELTRKGLQVIVSEAGRLEGFVEELLDFSRLQSGRMTLRLTKTDILAELEETLFTFTERAVREGYKVKKDIPEVASVSNADPNRLKQVFMNILDNALKYSRPGSSIYIKAQFEKNDGKDFVRISIADQGCGISAEDLPHVKDKFYKANVSVKGSGIGLAVTNEIVNLHHGILDIDSVEGKGTLVTIHLPVDEIYQEEI